jgi:hypothetical protein
MENVQPENCKFGNRFHELIFHCEQLLWEEYHFNQL